MVSYASRHIGQGQTGATGILKWQNAFISALNLSAACIPHSQKVSLTDGVSTGAELLSVVVYLTPAGTVDEGRVEQPAYLNIDVLLLAPPAGALKGVIGEGYERLTSPNAVAEEDDFKFHGQLAITHHVPARKNMRCSDVCSCTGPFPTAQCLSFHCMQSPNVASLLIIAARRHAVTVLSLLYELERQASDYVVVSE